jgi:hypothetical protein
MSSSFISVCDLEGWRIDGVTFSRQCGWDIIAEHIAQHFHCDCDDVGTQEGAEDEPDEGVEYVTIKGERVGYLEGGLR